VTVRVVLADDHAVVRGGVRWALDGQNGIHVVSEAATVAELLEVLESIEVDVVVLDIRMPGRTGLDALPEIVARWPDRRVVMLSMHDDPAMVRTAIERGASAYLLKSAGTRELVAAIRAVAAGHSYIQSSLILPVLGGMVDAAETRMPADEHLELLRLVAAGLSNAEIGEELGLAESAVKTTIRSAFGELGVATRAEAVATALRRGLID
jgi:DNA-binding NarL/FixJ family response regulator